MVFHNSFMLWGLSALLIPIIFHFFSLRRAKRVYFSHLPFLQKAVHTTRIHTRLQRLLLLIVRLLALSSLILAFAQPYLPRLSTFSRSAAALFYLDNSYSMESIGASGETLLEQALSQATQLLKSYPPNYTFFVLSNDTQHFVPLSKEDALDALSIIQPTHLSIHVQALQRTILSTLQSVDMRADVYWFSDLQAHLFRDRTLTIDTLHRWHIFPLSASQTDNLYIDTAYVQAPVLAREVPSIVCVRVQNSQKTPCSPCIIQFFVENKPLTLQTIDLLPQSRQEVCFNYTSIADARAFVQIQGPRPLFDNIFYFTLRPTPPIRVLEIAPKTASHYISYVYAKNMRFNYLRFLPEEAEEASQLAEADLIILHDLPTLSLSLQAYLVEQLNQGHTLLIVPSERLSASHYATFLPHLRQIEVPSSSSFTSLNIPEVEDPFFQHMFTSSSDNFSMPKGKPLYIWRPSDKHTLLSFADGQSFLSKSTQSGTCYFLTSPLESSYTDFMHHPLFVPVLYKIASLSQSLYAALILYESL